MFETFLGVLASLVGIATFVAFDVPQKFRDWYYSIFCTPKLFEVKPSPWAITKTAHVVNNNPYPIFGVQLKIYGEEEIMKGVKVRVETKHLVTAPSDSFPVDANAFLIFGENKSKKEVWIRAMLAQINPQDQVDVVLEFLSLEKGGLVKLKVTDFSRESLPILRQENTVAFQFTIKD